jgi:uncharacterized protein YoxC
MSSRSIVLVLAFAVLAVGQQQSPQKTVDNFVVQQAQMSSQIITLLTQIPSLVARVDSLQGVVNARDSELKTAQKPGKMSDMDSKEIQLLNVEIAKEQAIIDKMLYEHPELKGEKK